MTTTPTLSPEALRPHLLRLANIALSLDDLYEASDGEVTEVAGLMEEFLSDEREICLESLVWWIRELNATSQACKDEAARISEVRRRLGKRTEFAKQTIRDLLGEMGVRKIDLGTFKISLRKGGQSVALSEQAPDGLVDLLEEEFQRIIPETVEPDKKAIAAALKDNRKVPFHSLVRGPDSVVIK